MPGKTFRNQTGRDVYFSVTIRKGDEPWVAEYGVGVIPVFAGRDHAFSYGDDANPFVDSIQAAFDQHFQEGLTRVDAEVTRGGANDTAMNTNDTVTATVGGDGTVALAFSNG